MDTEATFSQLCYAVHPSSSELLIDAIASFFNQFSPSTMPSTEITEASTLGPKEPLNPGWMGWWGSISMELGR